MVTINITDQDGKAKTYSSRPLSFGLQKAFARYGIRAAQILEEAKMLEDGTNVDEHTNKYDKIAAGMEELYNEKTALVIRAFGNQFTVDELDIADAEQVDVVMAKLRLESQGIVQKN